MKKSLIQSGIAVAVAITLVLVGIGYYHYKKIYPSTNDAYVQAHILYVSPQVTGDVDQVLVQNYEFVHKGQLLFTIRPQPFEIALQKAKANLTLIQSERLAAQSSVATAKATLAKAKAQFYAISRNSKRTIMLVKEHYSSKAAGDTATSNLRVAQANVLSAKNQLAEAKYKLSQINNGSIAVAKTAVADAQLNLNYTKIYAPSDGYIANFTLRDGAKVSAYQPLFAIVETHQWWIEANYKETDMDRIRVGQPVKIKIDMYSHTFHGKVISIARASGDTFSIMPPENGTGNWVKVTQRFPVRIKIESTNKKFPLRVGASATVTIDTHQIHS